MSGDRQTGLPPEPDYIAEVEARIAELRGAPLVLSTRDWERVCGWRRQGIPLPVVLRALGDVLGGEGREEGRRAPRSLAYCERAVQQHWKAKREAWIGRPGPSAAPSRRVRTVLNTLARQIEGAARKARRESHPGLARALRTLASKLRELGRLSATSANPFDELAPALRGAESAFHLQVRAALGEGWNERRTRERDRLREQIRNMDPDAATTTVDAAILRRLREELGVPGFDLGAVHARLQAEPARRRLTARSKPV